MYVQLEICMYLNSKESDKFKNNSGYQMHKSYHNHKLREIQIEYT